MIQSFIESWSLFHLTYETGLLIALLLALAGVLVVARDQIFIGAAVSQASTLGIACSMWLASCFEQLASHEHSAESMAGVMAVVFSVLAAWITMRGGGRTDSHEAITGWIFLMSSSLSILIVAHSPLGLDEIHRLLSSSIIGSSLSDVVVFATLALTAAVALVFHRSRLVLLVTDPAMAAASGLRVARWDLFIATSLGVMIGLGIRSSGLIFTFGCLVLPALIAKQLCREVRPMFWVAPLVSVSVCLAGFVVSNHYDFPPAQMSIALLSAGLALAWLAKWFRG